MVYASIYRVGAKYLLYSFWRWSLDMRFLILDSEEKSNAQMKYWLKEMDDQAEVISACRVEDALYNAVNQEMDGFIVDPAAREKDGKEGGGLRFLSRIRMIRNYHFTGILIMTRLEDAFSLLQNIFHCCGYLYKPLDRDGAFSCLDYFYDYALFRRMESRKKRMLYIKKGKGFELISLSSVIRISFRSHETEVLYPDKRDLFDSRNFGRQMLRETDRFVFCNRSDAVNMDYMESCDGRSLKLVGGMGSVDVTRAGRDSIRRYLRESRYDLRDNGLLPE